MPRKARIVIPDVPHHITQRGNNRQDVFFVDDDFRVYLSFLRDHSHKFGLEILGWCLMPNHIHLIARPAAADSLAKALGRTHYRYTQYVNAFHKRSGHLWQNRFYSCPLGREHFWHALRYIEQNPVRAGITRLPWNYKWSSAVAHTNHRDKTGLLNITYWQKISKLIDWKAALQHRLPEETTANIRANTQTGRPLATDAFISKLEKTLNKRLRPLPVGRPKNKVLEK